MNRCTTSDHRKFAVVESALGNVMAQGSMPAAPMAQESIPVASSEGTRNRDVREMTSIQSVCEIDPMKIIEERLDWEDLLTNYKLTPAPKIARNGDDLESEMIESLPEIGLSSEPLDWVDLLTNYKHMADPTISKTSEDESHLVVTDGLNSSDSALHDQRGTDLTPVYSEYDSSLSFIDTYTNGSYEVFLFQSNSSFKLIVLNPKRRFKMPFSGRQVFIRSSCLQGYPRSCSGCVVAYALRLGGGWADFELGIIEAMRYFQKDSPIHFVELWRPSSKSFEVDVFFSSLTWESVEPFLEKVIIPIEDIKMFFVNQVRFCVPVFFAFLYF